MPTIRDYYESAKLAAAAYVNLSGVTRFIPARAPT